MTSPDRGFPRPDDAEEPRSVASSGEHAGGATPADTKKKKQLPLWQESILLLVVALVIAVVVKTFFVQAFYIPSESMEPGLVQNDRILVEKVTYWTGEPQRGDVVVFRDPGGWLPDSANAAPSNPLARLMTKVGLYPEGGHLVKRIIGVAGDVVECCDEDGNIMVNGVSIDEKGYVKDDETSPCNGPMKDSCSWKSAVVPQGHVFVMGDNRNHSADSSFNMCSSNATDCVPGREFVPTDLIVGRVAAVIWPLDRARIVHRPKAFDDVPNPS